MKTKLNRKPGKVIVTIFLFILACTCHSQIKIISSVFSGYNVSPENMCGVTLSSQSGEMSAFIEANITNMQGALVIHTKSNPFPLRSGINNSLQSGLTISNTNYQSSTVIEYIRNYHQLPSGKYNYCVSVKLTDGSGGDELCDEIESESSTYITLINPFDKDTISTFNPILIWNHSESFNVIQQGEYYRMLISELKQDQSAEAAINVNSPLYQYNFLTRHDVLYPIDAPKLEAGKQYAWQVQKVVNGVITNKTEAWQFTLNAIKEASKSSFVEISPKLNPTPYQVQGDKIYFVFKEEYGIGSTELKAFVTDNKGTVMPVKAKNYQAPGIKESELKKTENNRFEIDLRELDLKEGLYILKILNQKNQEFLLKFRYDNL